LKTYFKKIATKQKSNVKDEGKKFLSVVGPYTLGIFDKPTESYKTINTERFAKDVLGLFESMESERPQTGFGFAVGLWYGVFFSGQEWLNEDLSKRDYRYSLFGLMIECNTLLPPRISGVCSFMRAVLWMR